MVKVIEQFNLKKVDGGKEIGIEIEVEGRKLFPNNDYQDEPIVGPWRITKDGSLRGENAEYVLRVPIKRQDVNKCLARLVEYFKTNDTTINETDRCGVHIHVNCQELEVKQVINFILLYLIFEDLLVKYCGEAREGNLFCLRARDAEVLLDYLRIAKKLEDLHILQDDSFRYASCNISAIGKYGSLEFRSLKTPDDMMSIQTWVNILLKLKDFAVNIEDARDIVEAFSRDGELEYLRRVFGPYAEALECKEAPRLMREGVRRIQDIAYTKFDANAVKKKARYQGFNVGQPGYNPPPAQPDGLNEALRELKPNIIAGTRYLNGYFWLREDLRERKLVVYKGGWCFHDNIQAAELNRAEAENAGYVAAYQGIVQRWEQAAVPAEEPQYVFNAGWERPGPEPYGAVIRDGKVLMRNREIVWDEYHWVYVDKTALARVNKARAWMKQNGYAQAADPIPAQPLEPAPVAGVFNNYGNANWHNRGAWIVEPRNDPAPPPNGEPRPNEVLNPGDVFEGFDEGDLVEEELDALDEAVRQAEADADEQY